MPNLGILHDYGVLGGGRCYGVGGVEVRGLLPKRSIMYSTLPLYFDVDDEAQSVAAVHRSHLGLETPTRQRQENSSPSTKYAFGDVHGHSLV